MSQSLLSAGRTLLALPLVLVLGAAGCGTPRPTGDAETAPRPEPAPRAETAPRTGTTPRPEAPSRPEAAPRAEAGSRPPSTDTSVALGAPFTLALGASAEVDGRTVRFDAVTEDSRCPIGTTCVWEGRARVSLSMTGTDGLTLEIPGGVDAAAESGHVPVAAGGLRVTLLALDPHPQSEAVAPAPTPRATLRVDRGGATGGAPQR